MSDTIQVLILTPSPMPEPLVERLRAISPRLSITPRTARTLEELGDMWRGVEVLYTTWLMPAPEQAPDLKWVQGHFAGVEHFLENPLLQRVTLTTTSGVHAPAMAEYIVMMMLAFAHRLPRMIDGQRSGRWPADKDRWPLFVPRELRGATVGIVGYGSIGREAARLARTFGMRVLATKRDLRNTGDEGWRLPGVGDPASVRVERLYAPEELGEMLAECDYVAITVPLSPATRNLIGAEQLRRMKPEAVLINVSRGGVVDEPALVEALQSGTIGGAALDVFAVEPLPAESPLWRMPNVILSPHVSGFTPHYDERAMALFGENLRRYVNGEALLNVVETARGY